MFSMESQPSKDDDGGGSTLSESSASGISLSVEENEMIFFILKELDLFLESEESVLKKEIKNLDAAFETKVSISDTKYDIYKRTKELNGLPPDDSIEKNLDDTDGNSNHDNDATVKKENIATVKKEDACGNDLEDHGRTDAIESGKDKISPDVIIEEDEDDDDEDDDGTLDGSFGMPMADACAECFHTQIKSALTNSVQNSHVACLQAILEQLFQTREVTEKRKQRNIQSGVMNGTKSSESHVMECNYQGDDMELNLSASPLLLQAVSRGHAQIVHLILKCLEDLNQLHDSLLIADSTGLRPIHLAAYLNHTSCLDLLLQQTPVKRVYWRDKHGRTPLLVAAAGGAVQCVKRLITVDDVGATNNSGANAVCLAAQAGSVGCLEVLIDQAMMDPAVGDETGITPLHFAAEAGHLNCTHWLVRRATCSLNVQRKQDGATPMHLAAAKGRCPIIQWALNRELSRGDELDFFGRTPVHYAAEEGQITALKTFAKFVKVDLGAKDFLSRTPSHLAERRGHLGCVRYLDSSSKHGRSDRPGKIARSLSTSNVNKLVRRGSGRRSTKRREISSVYVDGLPSPGANNGVMDPLSLEAYLSGRKSGNIVPKMVTQVGLMSLATIVPDASFLRGIIRSDSVDLKSEGDCSEMKDP